MLTESRIILKKEYNLSKEEENFNKEKTNLDKQETRDHLVSTTGSVGLSVSWLVSRLS